MQGAWIENKRTEAPNTIFKNGDGFELYIDAVRFLPDNCAFVKVNSLISNSRVEFVLFISIKQLIVLMKSVNHSNVLGELLDLSEILNILRIRKYSPSF